MSIACCPRYLPHRARLNRPSGVGWFSLRVWRVEILKNHHSCGLKKVWPVGFHLWLEGFHKVTLYLGKGLDHSHHLPLDCCSQHAPQSGVRYIERERDLHPAVWAEPLWWVTFQRLRECSSSSLSCCLATDTRRPDLAFTVLEWFRCRWKWHEQLWYFSGWCFLFKAVPRVSAALNDTSSLQGTHQYSHFAGFRRWLSYGFRWIS